MEKHHLQRKNRKLFSKEEDDKLILLHNRYDDDWKKIAKEMDGRSIRQCKERYCHYLNPDINLSDWTSNEDNLLNEKVQEIGKKWKILEYIFPGRTEISIRNRWNVLQRKERKRIRENEKRQKFKTGRVDKIVEVDTSENDNSESSQSPSCKLFTSQNDVSNFETPTNYSNESNNLPLTPQKHFNINSIVNILFNENGVNLEVEKNSPHLFDTTEFTFTTKFEAQDDFSMDEYEIDDPLINSDPFF